MYLTIILSSLLVDNLFVTRKIQLYGVITNVKMFFITVIYVLLFLYDRLPIYIVKSVYILIYNKSNKKIKKINEFVYLPILLYRTTTLF